MQAAMVTIIRINCCCEVVEEQQHNVFCRLGLGIFCLSSDDIEKVIQQVIISAFGRGNLTSR